MGSQLFPDNLATLPPGPLSTGSAGLIGSDPMKSLRASSTPPGYSICAWQCSTITHCYCISPRDILGSSQAGSSNAGTGDQAAKGERQSCWTGGRSALSMIPKAGRSTWWPPYPLSAWLPGATTIVFFSGPFASALLMFPPPPTSAYHGHSLRSLVVVFVHIICKSTGYTLSHGTTHTASSLGGCTSQAALTWVNFSHSPNCAISQPV